MAAHSVSATTPTKLPSRTTFTIPGICGIEDSSTLAGCELMTGGRTDAAVQHAGNAHIGRVGKFAGEFLRQIEARHRRADDLVILGIFRFHFGRNLQVPLLAAGRDLGFETLCRRRAPHR